MHLYVLFLSGKRLEIEVSQGTKIQELLNLLIRKDSLLKDKQFSLLFDKKKRIITKDEYDKTLQQLEILKEDYLTIVLDKAFFANQKGQAQIFIQQAIPDQKQLQISSSQNCTKLNNNLQTQTLSEQIIITPSLQCQLNQQIPQPSSLVQTQSNQIQENQDAIQAQFQNQETKNIQENPLQLQLEELKKSKQQLQEKINQLIEDLDQVNNKIKYLVESSNLLQFINLNKQKMEITEQFLFSNIQNKTFIPLTQITTQIQQNLEQMKVMNDQIQTNQGLQKDSYLQLIPTLASQQQNYDQTDGLQSNNQFQLSAQQQFAIQQPVQIYSNQEFQNNSQEVQYLKVQLQSQYQYIEELNKQIQIQQQTIHGIIYFKLKSITTIYNKIKQRLKYNIIHFLLIKFPPKIHKEWNNQFQN